MDFCAAGSNDRVGGMRTPLSVEPRHPGPNGPAARGEDVRRECWPPERRLRRRADFLRVQRNGRRIHTPHYVVILQASDPGALRRMGITVTKKVANAVGRNRVKRVLREVFRRNDRLFPDSCEIVVIAKSGAHLLGYADALGELTRARRPMARAADKARAHPRSAQPHPGRPARTPTKIPPEKIDEP